MEEVRQVLVAAVHANPKRGWRTQTEALFKSWDCDDDGKLDVSELANGLERIGMPLEAEQVKLQELCVIFLQFNLNILLR